MTLDILAEVGQMEGRISPDILEARKIAIEAFSRNVTGAGIVASGVGRFHGVFIRDAATGEDQALEKPQNGASALLIEGARRTLITGATHQGTKNDFLTREQKGETPHEIHGEDANQEHLAAIASAPDGGWVHKVGDHYEGKNFRGLDPTLWWMTLLADYTRVSGDFSLMEQLWPNLEAAVAWSDRFGNGLIKGGFEGGKPPRNLGWKDSERAFVDEDGNFPRYPVAPLDVNCVAYVADKKIAGLYELLGNHKKAQALRDRADRRREMIEDVFWLDEYSVYAPAADAFDRPVRVRTSDSVYALWAGVTNGRSPQIARSMLESDLFISGRGLRTRSTYSRQFDHKDYQNGPVWYQLAPMAAAACEKLALVPEAAAYDSCISTIVQEGFPELDSVDRSGNVLPYTEMDSIRGVEKPVGCRNFTMTIGAVLNRLAEVG